MTLPTTPSPPPGSKIVTVALSPAIAQAHPRLMRDTLCTALAGGIVYWAEVRGVIRNEDGEYVLCEVRPSRDEGLAFDEDDARNNWQVLDPEKIEAAMLRVINEDLCREPVREWILSDYLDPLNSGNIDADSADVIVQVALFGEIVFG